MSASPTFAQLLDDAALLSLEHQLHLMDVVGDHHSWNADLNEPFFEFTGARPYRCTRFHLIGTAAADPESWLWSWANPSACDPQLVRLAEYVRDFGQRHGIPELAQPEVPFHALPVGDTEPSQAAGMMLEAAKAASNIWSGYAAEIGGGTWIAFLIEHPEFALPPPEPARVMRVLQQALTDLPLTDHRRAIHGYATRRGLGATFNADHSQLAIGGPGLGVTVHFDQLGRVANISGTLGAGQPR